MPLPGSPRPTIGCLCTSARESVAPHNVRWDVSDEDLDSVFNF